MGLALAGIPGYGDMQTVRVFHSLRCHREDHAPGKDLVADMFLREGPEHQPHRVAVCEDIEGCCPGVGGCRGRALSTFILRFRRCPVLPPGLLFLLPVLPLRGPVRLEPLAQFLPPLSTAAAGRVLATGEDRAVAELDRKGPVLVS